MDTELLMVGNSEVGSGGWDNPQSNGATSELRLQEIGALAGNGMLSDLAAGLRVWPAWAYKGWYDIVLRYRRTAIGPLWQVITTGVMVACLAVVGPALFGGGDPNFIPYMVAGVLSWTYISLSISELSGAFTENAGDIRSVRGVYSTYVYRVIFRNQIIYGHLLLIFITTVLIDRGRIVPNVPVFVVGIVLVAAWLVAVGLFLAIVCARFRDIQQLISSILQVSFLLTPVFWDKSLLLGKSREWVIQCNPLFHLLELIRAPLLGGVPSLSSYFVTLAGVLIGGGISAFLFRKNIHRVPFWL